MIETPTAGALLLDGDDVAHADARARASGCGRWCRWCSRIRTRSLNPRKKVGTLLEEPLAINTTLAAAERAATRRAR